MNEVINKFLLAGDKSRYSRYIQDIQDIFIKVKLDKACFQHRMAYGDFKDLTRRTVSDKVLLDETFNNAKNKKYDRYQR